MIQGRNRRQFVHFLRRQYANGDIECSTTLQENYKFRMSTSEISNS